MILFGCTVLCSFFVLAISQDVNCNFSQTLQTGMVYEINNPKYPQKYTPGVTCRWLAIAPSGHIVKLKCPDTNIPSSSGCKTDRLMISKSGDAQLSEADTYCGRGSITTKSTQNKLVIGLITSKNSKGGYFQCYAEAVTEPQNPAQNVTEGTDLCRCGSNKTTSTVGSQEAGVNEFPFMAGIAYPDQGTTINCGGVIIDQIHVMTTAQCVEDKNATHGLAVIVGEHKVNLAETSGTERLDVANYTIHPRFNSTTRDYDVAIITLRDALNFSDRVGPVCLPFKYYNFNFTAQNITLLGWGTQKVGGPNAKYLQKVNVSVANETYCQSRIPAVTDSQICTYAPEKDSCQDDSGGPALYTDPSTARIYSIGIISYGRFCASEDPAINTRVTVTLDWILSTTGVNYCTL